MTQFFTIKFCATCQKKLSDWQQSRAFEASCPAFTDVLTRLWEYMLMGGRPKSTIIAYARQSLERGLGCRTKMG